MIDISLINNISNIKRFSGTHLLKDENIAEHSLEMALIAINYCELVPEINKHDLIYRCIIHDLEEVACGVDIPNVFKHEDEDLKKHINEVAYKMLNKKVSTDIYESVINSKDNTLEGFMLGLIDKMQCYLKISRETHLLGNKIFIDSNYEFRTVIESYLDYIKENDYGISKDSCKRLIDYTRELTNHYSK